MIYNGTRPTERLLKYPLISLYYLKIKSMYSIYIYPLLPQKKEIKKLVYLNHLESKALPRPSSLVLHVFFFFKNFFYLLPLPPLVFFGHEDKSLTQAFIETLFFLYQVNKQIIIYQKEVGVPSFRQAFFFFLSIQFNSFKKISQNKPMWPWLKKVSLLAKILT